MNVTPRLLVVDDTVDIRLMIARYLTHQGYQTTTAVDGMDALDQLRQSWPDLVLLDLSMPRMNGWETLKAIRTLPRGTSLPVIAITAHAMMADRERALASGFNGFITKPLAFDILLQMIDTLLLRSRSFPLR